MVNLAFQNIQTNMDFKYLLSYLVLAAELNPENLRLEQLPGQSVYTNGVWIFQKNSEETKALFEELKFVSI